jgi:hypothetical protein
VVSGSYRGIGDMQVHLAVLLACVFAQVLAANHPLSISEEERERIVSKYSTRHTDNPSLKKNRTKDAAKEHTETVAATDTGVELAKRAARTYEKVLPCLKNAWMMEGRSDESWAKWRLPDDAEHHFQVRVCVWLYSMVHA